MKKIVLTLVAVLSMTSVFADNSDKKTNENVKAVETTASVANLNYDMSVNYRMLGGTLNLNHNQIAEFVSIHDKFVGAVKNAGNASVSNRTYLVRKAAQEELNKMKNILDDSQYRKFNMLLNLTLSNRGLLH